MKTETPQTRGWLRRGFRGAWVEFGQGANLCQWTDRKYTSIGKIHTSHMNAHPRIHTQCLLTNLISSHPTALNKGFWFYSINFLRPSHEPDNQITFGMLCVCDGGAQAVICQLPFQNPRRRSTETFNGWHLLTVSPLLSILPTSSFPLSSHPQLQNLPSQFFSLCTQSYPLFTPACSQKPFCSSGKAWKIPDLLPRSGWQCSVFIRMQICLWTRFKESAFPSNGLPSSTPALVVFCVLVSKWEATGFQFEGTAAGGS